MSLAARTLLATAGFASGAVDEGLARPRAALRRAAATVLCYCVAVQCYWMDMSNVCIIRMRVRNTGKTSLIDRCLSAAPASAPAVGLHRA